MLLSSFESRGFAINLRAAGMRVTILDEPVGFRIEEGTKKVEHHTSFTKQKLIDRGLGYQVPKWDHEPSGYPALVIINVHGFRQRWTEGPLKPLERMLNKSLIGLVRAALRLKRVRRH